MIQLITGKKGKGKTKHLLDKVNEEIQKVSGSIVYLDKNTKHMYELNNKIRLIDVMDYNITNSDEFYGLICGILSGNHDVEQLYFDSFLKIAHLENEDITKIMQKLEIISQKFAVDFVLSISLDQCELPEFLQSNVIVSL